MITPRFQLSPQISLSIQRTTMHHYNIEVYIHDTLNNNSIVEYITQNKLEELIKFLQEQRDRKVAE